MRVKKTKENKPIQQMFFNSIFYIFRVVGVLVSTSADCYCHIEHTVYSQRPHQKDKKQCE